MLRSKLKSNASGLIFINNNFISIYKQNKILDTKILSSPSFSLELGFFNTNLEILGNKRQKAAVLYVSEEQDKIIIDIGLIKPTKVALEQEIELIWGRRITLKGKVSVIRTLARKYEIVLAKSIFPVISANITEKAIILKYCKEIYLWKRLIIYRLAKIENNKKTARVEKKVIRSYEELKEELKKQKDGNYAETVVILPKNEKIRRWYKGVLKEGVKIRRVCFANEFRLLKIAATMLKTKKKVKKAIIVLTKELKSAEIVIQALKAVTKELIVMQMRNE